MTPVCPVGLNGRFSGTLHPTGTQVASFQLFDAIVRADRDFPVVVWADPQFPGVAAWADIPQTTLVQVPFSRWRRSTAQLWEQVVFPVRARAAGCRLLHHPMNTCPRWRNGITQLVTLHDLNFHHHPEWTGRAFRLWLNAFTVPAVRRADHVATISDYVLADIRATLDIPADRSSRIYNGRTPLPPAVRTRTAPDVKVILGVNLWQPHKNLARLIEAFSAVREHVPGLELHLAGRPQANYRSQPELAALTERPGVKILGYLSDEELAAAYADADLVCYPSLTEGFGLPILEAMAAGAPVVTSNTTSLPEVAGGAAILVDPYSTTDIAAGISAALDESEDARAARIALGCEVAERFSWPESARQYIELYRRLS